jgi:hypothetical protein
MKHSRKVSTQWVPQIFSEKRSVEDAIKTYKLSVYCRHLKGEAYYTSWNVFENRMALPWYWEQ